MAASTRSLVSLPTAALSLSTAETVALDTPVWRATSEMVGRFPVIVGSAGVSISRTGLNAFKPVQAGEHRLPISDCQVGGEDPGLRTKGIAECGLTEDRGQRANKQD